MWMMSTTTMRIHSWCRNPLDVSPFVQSLAVLMCLICICFVFFLLGVAVLWMCVLLFLAITFRFDVPSCRLCTWELFCCFACLVATINGEVRGTIIILPKACGDGPFGCRRYTLDVFTVSCFCQWMNIRFVGFCTIFLAVSPSGSQTFSSLSGKVSAFLFNEVGFSF